MTVEITVPCAERRFELTCYNAGTNGAITANCAVQLATGTVPNVPAVNRAGTTAATVTRAFGVALVAAATAASTQVVILGPAKVTANATIAVGAMVGLTVGTAGVRGRVTTLAATATAGTVKQKLLGYALTAATGAGKELLIMVGNAPLRSA